MALLKKVDASRRNALKKTPEHLDIDALKSMELRLLPDEDPETLARIYEAFRAEHQPAGPTEEVILQRMVDAYWRLRRISHIEAGILKWGSRSGLTLHDMLCVAFPERFRPRTPEEEAALKPSGPGDPDPLTLAFIRDCSKQSAMSKLARYEIKLERTFDSSLRQLERLKSARMARRDNVIPIR